MATGYILKGNSIQLDSSEYKKIQLIQGIDYYWTHILHLKNLPEFYTRWENKSEKTYYLYISKSDTVSKPQGIPFFLFFGSEKYKADSAENVYKQMGYSTLIYATAGNSSALLSKPLLAYPPHSIAFIAFHELTHRYKTKTRSRLSYNFEEAACDIIGNYVSISFFKWFSDIHPEFKPYIDSALTQTEINENIYTIINNTISGNISNQRAEKHIEPLRSAFNPFQKDRFGYPINNAFLLRTSYYGKNYFLLKGVYIQLNSNPTRFIKKIMKLGEDPAKVEIKIRKFLR